MANKKSSAADSTPATSAQFSSSLLTNSDHKKDTNNTFQGKDAYESRLAKMVIEVVIFCLLFFSAACLMAGIPILESLSYVFLYPLGDSSTPYSDETGGEEGLSLKASVCKGSATMYLEGGEKKSEENSEDSEYTYNICFGTLRCDELHEEWTYMQDLTETTYAKQRIQYLMSSVAHNLREKHGEDNSLAMEEFIRIPLTCEKASFHPSEIKQFEEMQKHYQQLQQMEVESGLHYDEHEEPSLKDPKLSKNRHQQQDETETQQDEF